MSRAMRSESRTRSTFEPGTSVQVTGTSATRYRNAKATYKISTSKAHLSKCS